MWIECTNDAVESLYVEEAMDEPVEFSDNGKAQVKEVVGRALVNRYEGVVESGESDGTDEQEETEDN